MRTASINEQSDRFRVTPKSTSNSQRLGIQLANNSEATEPTQTNNSNVHEDAATTRTNQEDSLQKIANAINNTKKALESMCPKFGINPGTYECSSFVSAMLDGNSGGKNSYDAPREQLERQKEEKRRRNFL